MRDEKSHALGIRARRLFVIGVLVALGCASGGLAEAPSEDTTEFGVLVMAHGGTDEWNEAVLDATRQLEPDYPVEVAFGMASAGSLQEAVTRLEAQGVERIGVVRLFVSGESWYERTRQILGVEPGAPDRHEAPAADHHAGHHDFAATFWRIDTESAFGLSREGLSNGSEMSLVLLDRARQLSEDPARESVLVLAHGPGDDGENERWLAALDELVQPMRDELGFRTVAVHTLREDWDEKRTVAEAGIRAFVEQAASDDGRCLVIPFRVFGFGPYAEVLEGLEYVSDGQGLLPHEAVAVWMRRQAAALETGSFEPVVGSGDDAVHAGH
jgi:sirohydrochlorin ferrochelatase